MQKLGCLAPIHEMNIGTIHSICNYLIQQFIDLLPIKKNYKVLDPIMQTLFFNDNFDKIITSEINLCHLKVGMDISRIQIANKIIPFLNMIAEELIDTKGLLLSDNRFLSSLGKVYENYSKLLFSTNKLDFAHQQKLAYLILDNEEALQKIRETIKFIIVDEYQDTNYIQEQIFLRLAAPDNNICVVGDEDQSLYRFRGSTVKNILEFRSHFPGCQIIKLTVNYRSHPRIVDFCNKFVDSINWTNAAGFSLRAHKTMSYNQLGQFGEYPAIFSIQGSNKVEDCRTFAQIIKDLKEDRIIHNYEQVALLLPSVKLDSREYAQALNEYHIPFFVHKSKNFFTHYKIQLMLACYALLFRFYAGYAQKYRLTDSVNTVEYIDEAIDSLYSFSGVIHSCSNILEIELKKFSL